MAQGRSRIHSELGGSTCAIAQVSIERRSLIQAEAAARELPRMSSEDTLALVLLMSDEQDVRAERAMVRWLGQWLTETPQVGLDVAAEIIAGLADLQGASPDVARSQLAFVFRSVGCDQPARVLEQW